MTEPVFPGPAYTVGGSPNAPQSQSSNSHLIWRPLAQHPAVSWRNDIVKQYSQYSPTRLELHVIPIPSMRFEARHLSHMGEELATIGRKAGLFSQTQALIVETNDRYAYATSQPGPRQDEVGLAVTRTAQRTSWLSLPHDSMGSVFDQGDLRPRITALIKLLRSIPLPESERIAFALHIEPLMLLSIGSASAVGHRSQTTMPFASRASCSVLPEDALTPQSLDAKVDGVAEELVERLAAALRSV